MTHDTLGSCVRHLARGTFDFVPSCLGFAPLGYGPDPSHAAAALLLDAAFAANPDGIVAASMFGAGHLTGNLTRAGRVCAEAPALLQEMLA